MYNDVLLYGTPLLLTKYSFKLFISELMNICNIWSYSKVDVLLSERYKVDTGPLSYVSVFCQLRNSMFDCIMMFVIWNAIVSY